jgi:hypothetical protein
MQIKRNDVIVIRANERTYTKPRLAIVKSVRKDGSINCTFAMYKDSNIMTDYIMSAEEVQTDVVSVTEVSASDFRNLATCFPNKDPNDPFIRRQAVLDAQYPAYAAMRKAYGPYETITQGIERLRREGKIAA